MNLLQLDRPVAIAQDLPPDHVISSVDHIGCGYMYLVLVASNLGRFGPTH